MGPVSVVFNLRGEVVSVVLGRRVSSPCVDGSVMDLLRLYLAGVPVGMDGVPVRLDVSPFVRRVLEEVRRIPWGEVLTYGELARRMGVRSARAVGMALGKNPVPIIVPCHRVVAKRGLGGFSSGLDWKRFLLKLEGHEAY